MAFGLFRWADLASILALLQVRLEGVGHAAPS
jgi:hypothetical protein